jgi:hypothetical protein
LAASTTLFEFTSNLSISWHPADQSTSFIRGIVDVVATHLSSQSSCVRFLHKGFGRGQQHVRNDSNRPEIRLGEYSLQHLRRSWCKSYRL